VSSISVRDWSDTSFRYLVMLDDESSRDWKSSPAPLKALYDSSSKSLILSLGMLFTSALT